MAQLQDFTLVYMRLPWDNNAFQGATDQELLQLRPSPKSDSDAELMPIELLPTSPDADPPLPTEKLTP